MRDDELFTTQRRQYILERQPLNHRRKIHYFMWKLTSRISASSSIKNRYAVAIIQRNSSKKYYGFTLVELLLALTIAGILAMIGLNSYRIYYDRLQINNAKNDILIIELAIQRFYTINSTYPETLNELTEQIPLLDPWKNPYQYLTMSDAKGKGKVRKDHNLNPLNTDYDLYSAGKDGKSVSPLTAKASQDDIIRANNGGFIGLASDY